MNREKEFYARSLASMILVDEDHGPPYISNQATPRIHIEMQAMIHNICRNIRFDSALMSQQIEDELKKQLNEINLDVLINQYVAEHVARVKKDLFAMVRLRVEKIIELSIDNSLGSFPLKIAEQVAATVSRVMHSTWKKTWKL